MRKLKTSKNEKGLIDDEGFSASVLRENQIFKEKLIFCFPDLTTRRVFLQSFTEK